MCGVWCVCSVWCSVCVCPCAPAVCYSKREPNIEEYWEKLTKGRLPESTEVAEIRGAPMIVLLLPLSDARKYSRRQDPGGRRLGSTEIAEIRGAPMIVPRTVAPLWGSEIQPEPRAWRETSGEH